MIRVVLADDQSLVRAGFRVLVDSAADLEVVGEASNGREAVDQARSTRADVLLMDIRMPGSDGLVATREITSNPALAGVRVLVLATFDVDEYVFAALRAGASGFLGKGVEPVELQEAIRDRRPRGRAALSRRHPRAHRPFPQRTPASSPTRRARGCAISPTGSVRRWSWWRGA